jgi:hypothetical protein
MNPIHVEIYRKRATNMENILSPSNLLTFCSLRLLHGVAALLGDQAQEQNKRGCMQLVFPMRMFEQYKLGKPAAFANHRILYEGYGYSCHPVYFGEVDVCKN